MGDVGKDTVPLHLKRWLSMEEAVIWTGTDVEWINEHIKSGALPCVQTAKRKPGATSGPKRLRFDRLKLDELMERLSVAAAAKPKEPSVAEAPRSATKKRLSFRELRAMDRAKKD